MRDKENRIAVGGVRALAVMRIAVGALAWARPDLAAASFGMARPDGQARYLWRLFGIRDVVVGVGTVATSGTGRRTWATVGLVCDVADGAAGALGRGEVSKASAAAMIGVPAAAVAFGSWAVSALGR